MKKALKKIAFLLFSAVMVCCFFVGCGLSTKIQVTYMNGTTQYTVQEYDLNQQITLPAEPVVEGQKFIGWYTDAACTQPYAEGKITAGLTLYAKFEPAVIYIIIDTVGGESIPMQGVQPGGEYELPEAVKEGHTFTGYYYYADGVKQDFPTSGVIPFDTDTVIYASYAINTYTVTLNDGFSAEPTVAEVEYNKLYTPNKANRPGYTFVAWHTVAENQTTETVYDATQPVKANVSLYAQYTANDYKITVANNADSETETVDVTYDAAYELTAADKAGWTFVGYTFNGEEFAAKGTYTYAQNIRITANYSKNAYAVTFKDAATGEEIVTRNVEHGDKVSEPTADLAKVGYTYTLSADLNNAITQATEILVTYTANPYKITITNNVNNSTQVVDVVYNGAYTLSANAITGYTFANFTFDGEEFNASATYGYTHNITVMANYTLNKYAVTFKDAATGDVLATQEVAHGGKAVEPALSRVGYTYTLSADLNDAITEATEITVTYTAKTAVVTVIGAQDGYTLPTIVFGEKFTLVAPTRLGYNFEGFTGSDGKTYEADVEYTCDFESLTLTAQFDSDEKLVTFVANGVQVSQATVLSGYKASRPATDPSVDGYTFKGWSTKADELVAYNFDATVTRDITLYAYFEANEYQITIDLDGGTGATNLSVTYGGSYTLTAPTKKGYIFAGYEANGSTFALTGTYNVVGNTAIKATWTADNKTVTFHANDEVYTTETVLNGYTVAAPATAPTKAGYTFKGWYTSEAYTNAYVFTTEVTANLDLYAKFEANTYTITINLNGGTGIATSMSVTYNAHYDLSTLGTPSKLGYIFNGYDIETEGTYTVVGNTEATVQWTADNKTVVFEADGVEFTTATVLKGHTVAAPTTVPTKTGYTFEGWKNGNTVWNFSTPVNDDITLVAVFSANTYTITINNDGGEGETSKSVIYNGAYDLTAPTKEGYTFVKYVKANGDEFPMSGTYTIAESIVLTAVWKKNLSEGTWFDDTPEKGVFVYLVGYKYTFSSTGLEIGTFISGDASCVTISGGNNAVLEAHKPCEFTVTVTKYDVNGSVVETYERTMKIVETVATFTAGEDYRSAWINRNADNFDNDTKGDAMAVGRENYIPDVKVQKLVDNKLVALSLADANVDVEVLVDGGATTDYTLSGNAFTFAEALVGKTITVNLTPRYSIYDGQNVSFSFVLNNGINVYDNATFKAAYADTTVAEINVLRNIKMELSADQMVVATGNETTKGDYTFTVPAGTVAPKNGNGGNGVYERVNGNLTVNGNYFTADGSNIPLVDNRIDSWGFGSAKNGYILANVQFSLFKFGVDDLSKATDDLLRMENLYILGNMGEATNYGQNDGESYKIYDASGNGYNMLTMSGAAIGVQARYANIDLDNVTIRRAVLGLNAYSTYHRTTVNPVGVSLHGETGSLHGTTIYAKDCIIEECWANNTYMWGFGLITLDSSVIGECSGAAMHVDARPTTSKDYTVNSKMKFNDTTVSNWLAGTETWFNAYDMSGMAGDMKSIINGTVLQATGNQLTILNKESGTEKMNFALLVKSGSGSSTEWQNNDKDGMPTVDVEGLNYLQIGGYDYVKFDTTSFGLTGENYMEGYLSLVPNV